jgi:hypothetical protein
MALKACRKHKAKLVIAKLDRLSRNVHFISGLVGFLPEVAAHVSCEAFYDKEHSAQDPVHRLAIDVAVEVAQDKFNVVAEKRQRSRILIAFFCR